MNKETLLKILTVIVGLLFVLVAIYFLSKSITRANETIENMDQLLLPLEIGILLLLAARIIVEIVQAGKRKKKNVSRD